MGLKLEKSYRKDPQSLDFGLFCLSDIYTNAIVHETLHGSMIPHSLTLEDYFAEPKKKGDGEDQEENQTMKFPINGDDGRQARLRWHRSRLI